jgi:PIN domain nuclease of toxin-antitoxin system
MKLLLDTHIYLWLIKKDNQLKQEIIDIINNTDNEVFLSVVSVWECVIKYQLGKLRLPESPEIYLPRKRKEYVIQSLNIDEESLKYLPTLPLIHKDPFDRLLMCQSLQHNAKIITEDTAILKYPSINVLNLENY